VLRNFYDQVVEREGVEGAAALGFAPQCGVFLLIYCLAVVVLCDAGAYFAGRAYGKHKLAPRISPGKTIEGTVGGALVGTLAGLVTKVVFDVAWPELSRGLGWSAAVVFGIAISGLAVTGDLVESLLKRDAQVKDAGAMLPGMGGMLDRIDSPLLGIPGMYYMMLFYVFLQVE
jgi:phosphatidate cytidylyltransferase